MKVPYYLLTPTSLLSQILLSVPDFMLVASSFPHRPSLPEASFLRKRSFVLFSWTRSTRQTKPSRRYHSPSTSRMSCFSKLEAPIMTIHFVWTPSSLIKNLLIPVRRINNSIRRSKICTLSASSLHSCPAFVIDRQRMKRRKSHTDIRPKVRCHQHSYAEVALHSSYYFDCVADLEV